MEDDCEQCDSDWGNGKYHVDLWIGPDSASNTNELNDCEYAITEDAGTIIVNPASNLPVDQTLIFSNGVCAYSKKK